MNMQSQSTGMIDAVTSFMQRLSQLTEWFLVVLGVILFCYAFAKGNIADHTTRTGPGR